MSLAIAKRYPVASKNLTNPSAVGVYLWDTN